ncbi:MAG: hypothetical protein FWD67_01640 [Betaproteobacteria bacterium]|nr:hypothetical protein [Betaproteobacteria bacterium]
MPGESHLLTIRLKPSPALLAVILIAHFAGVVALFLMNLLLMATIPLMLLLLVSAVLAVRAQERKRGLSLVLSADGALRVCREGGNYDLWARVLPSAVLFPAVLWFTLAWMAQNGRSRRLRLMLVAPEVIEGCGGDTQWRQLRTWLRHRALASGGSKVLNPADVV